MGLTAKEFARLPEEEQRKRYAELDNRESARYRIHHEPTSGKMIKSDEPPVQYTPGEREKQERNLFSLMKKFHDVQEDLTFEEWIKTVKHTD